MKLSILVPFRDADGTRTRAKEWIIRRWTHLYPEAEIIEASDDGVDPFNKSMAVNNAAAQATGDVLAILDADTWIDPHWVSRGLELMQTGVTWVIPARTSLRLAREPSEALLKLDPTGDVPTPRKVHTEGGVAPVVGFLWLVPRSAFETVGGMDERFRGWGGEDVCFMWAMDRMVGRHYKLAGTVYCLWHARPRDAKRERIWYGQDQHYDPAKEALAARYRKAMNRPAMLRVLSEEGGPLYGSRALVA